MSTNLKSRKKRPRASDAQPLDRFALAVMAILSVVIAAMLLLGTRSLPSVREFSWQKKAVGVDDVTFLITFTQPVNTQSVEKALKIEPNLDGKFSWAGRKMAYTLKETAPYGEAYKVSLPEATALSGEAGFEPFASEFRIRDRVFVYIGAEGKDRGRLLLFNLTSKELIPLTPADERVLDFKPYPGRDRILYSSINKKELGEGVSLPQIYTVTTGLDDGVKVPRWQFWRPRTKTAKTVRRLLDNKEYQNLKFDLSPNGEVIVVQRVRKGKPAEFGPWVLIDGEPPRALNTEPGGDFKIAPDNLSLLLQQGQGTAVIALQPDLSADEAGELLDFLPEYGLTLDIANDGSAAALVNFNQDDPEKRFTQSLFWVSNKGEEKPLLQTDGAILSAQFNESNEILYCVVNKLDPGEKAIAEGKEPQDANENTLQVTTGRAAPYLTAINVKTGKSQVLLELPPSETKVSLAPDGLAILFDEALTGAPTATASSKEIEGPTNRLWLLPLFRTPDERLSGNPVALPPTALEIAGKDPVWLP